MGVLANSFKKFIISSTVHNGRIAHLLDVFDHGLAAWDSLYSDKLPGNASPIPVAPGNAILSKKRQGERRVSNTIRRRYSPGATPFNCRKTRLKLSTNAKPESRAIALIGSAVLARRRLARSTRSRRRN
jgi:hypothetical protein